MPASGSWRSQWTIAAAPEENRRSPVHGAEHSSPGFELSPRLRAWHWPTEVDRPPARESFRSSAGEAKKNGVAANSRGRHIENLRLRRLIRHRARDCKFSI